MLRSAAWFATGMATRFWPGVVMLALVLLLLAGGPRLHPAFDDRGDPRPRQFA